MSFNLLELVESCTANECGVYIFIPNGILFKKLFFFLRERKKKKSLKCITEKKKHGKKVNLLDNNKTFDIIGVNMNRKLC